MRGWFIDSLIVDVSLMQYFIRHFFSVNCIIVFCFLCRELMKRISFRFNVTPGKSRRLKSQNFKYLRLNIYVNSYFCK